MLGTRIAQHIRQHPFILPVYLPTILIGFSWGIREPVLPLYARDFGASYWMVGLVLSGQYIGMLLGDVPSGLALSRLGQRKGMILGLSCVIFSTAALFWARSIPEVLGYRILEGLGFSIFAIARHAYLAENAAVGMRGRAVAIYGGINRIGRFAGPAVGGVIASALNLRFPFLVISGLSVLALLVVVVVVRDNPDSKPRGQASLSDLVRQLRTVAGTENGALKTAGAGHLFAQFVRTGRGVIIPLYAADVLGLDVASIGLIVSIGAAIDMTLFYPVGVIMDRWGRKFAIVPSFFLQGLGFALIPLTGGFAALAAVAGLIGLGNGMGSGTMMTLGADLAPDHARGEFLGIWRLIGDTGFTVGPIITGSVANVLALGAASFVLAGSGLVASLLFIFLVPETVKKKDRST